MIDKRDAWKVATACMWWAANRSVHQMLEWFFQGEVRREDDPYVGEWAERFRTRNFGRIWGWLDFQNQRRLIEEVLRVYEQDAERSLARAEAHHDKVA